MNGIAIESGIKSELHPYHIGSQVDLMFQTDDAVALLQGNVMAVQIVDFADNLISTLTATRISQVDNLYVAEYAIPFDIDKKYNILFDDVSKHDPDIYYLKDRWVFVDGTYVEYLFYAYKAYDQPVTNNTEYFLRIDPRLVSTDGARFAGNPVHFTGPLYPYYSCVQEVTDVYREIFSAYDSFAIAREIVNVSKVVNAHMKPDQLYIADKDRLMSGMRNYTKYQSAWNMLNGILNTTSEEKMLDTFKISRSTSGRKYLEDLATQAQKFALIIWGGGRDTPFISRMFEKGLYDPNRPNVGRANLDTSGWYPWVNTTSSSFNMMIDGNNVEVRGDRTIMFRSARNAYSGYGGGMDGGDVGYLSRI